LYDTSVKLYEADYYRWTQETSERLRCGKFSEIDVAALVDEVEDLGKRERSAIESRLAVLICHLLKWDCQPAKRSRSWQATVELQRTRVERLLRQSPSLRPFASEALPEIYAEAVLRAIKETGLDRNSFSAACPYTLEEILVAKEVAVNC
jgi:Domain of unknown function DUF29